MKKIADIRRSNLQKLVDADGLSSVSRRVKRSATQINDMLAGRKSFGEKVARAIEKEWDPTIPPLWLDQSPSCYTLNEPSGQHSLNEPSVVKTSRGERVPLISWVQAGHWCEAMDPFAPGDAEDWLFCPANHSSSTFALRVRGVSMEPKYRDGAIIYVDPERSADHLSSVIVRMEDEAEVTFKQLVIEGDKRFLRPLNPDWPGPKLISIDSDAVICGVVIGQFIED